VCKKSGILIGWDLPARRAIVVPATCDSWDCQECAARMAENWKFRAEIGVRAMQNKGNHVDFVTITSHEALPDFAATEKVWREAWARLYAALKRKKHDLCYMLVPEQHKSGRMHVHAVWNAEVSQRWLKDNARKRGLGYQCKVIRLSDTGGAAKYISKYIGKSLDYSAPAHFRRVRVSDNFPVIPKPETEHNGLSWEYVGTNGALSIVYEECQAKKVALIDGKTGEVFDDIDLGTIVSYA